MTSAITQGYLEDRANRILNYASERFQNVYTRLRNRANSLGADYYQGRAEQVFDYALNRIQSAVDRARSTMDSFGAAYLAVSYGLRQEVPFERWFFDHGFQEPINNSQDLMFARAWAVLAVIEGAVRISAEATCLIFSKLFRPTESERHKKVLDAQWTGFRLSLLAVISPNLAKDKAHDSEGRAIIGTSILEWEWGTLYSGKLDAPLWHIECHHYPWVERPS